MSRDMRWPVPDSLRGRVLFLLLVVLVPVLLAHGGAYYRFFQLHRNAQLDESLQVARAVGTAWDIYVSDLIRQEFALGLAIRHLSAGREQSSSLLSQIKDGYPAVHSLSWIGPQGQVIASTEPLTVGTDISNLPYFQTILEGRQWEVTGLLANDAQALQTPVLYVARGIHASNGSLEGIVSAAIDPDRLAEALHPEKLAQSNISIIDSQGRVVFQHPPAQLSFEERDWGSTLPGIREALAGQEVKQSVASPVDGRKQIMGIAPIPSLGWAALAARPEDVVMAPLINELLLGIATILIIAALSIIAVRPLGRGLLISLDQLREHALTLASGNFGGRLATSGPKEFREMGSALNQVAQEIQERELTLGRYKVLSEYTRDILYFTQPDGTIIEANAAAVQAYGYSRHELLSMNAKDLHAPETEPALSQQLATAQQAPILYETVHRRKDGSVFPVEVSSQGTTVNDEAVLVAIVRDISERKLVEEALRESEEKFRTLIGSVEEMVFTLDREQRYTGVYGQWADRQGYKADQLLGKTSGEVFGPKGAPVHDQANRRALAGENLVYTWSTESKGEVRHFETSLAPLRDAEGAVVGVVGICRDITQYKQAEQFREEYVSLISHDLRTPLTVVQAQAQWLGRAIERAGLKGREKESVASIVAAARRMNNMIQDLVDSVRLEAGQVRLLKWPINFRSFVSSLLERSAPVIGERKVVQEIPSELPFVDADQDRLERIVMNLLTNALKYSPPDTEVVIKAERTDHEAIISVRDYGAGIPPQDLPQIFERFYRAKGTRKAGGLGLGLYITRMLVEAHGGRIWAESEPGKGSTFYFTLPLA